MQRKPVSRASAATAATAAGLVLALGVAAGLVRRRRRSAALASGIPPAPATGRPRLRTFVTTRFNPVVVRLGLVGGPRSRWAYIEHVGRRTGTVYRTPVLPRPHDDHVYVPLPYGVDVDWARNVRAAGHCRLQLRGTTSELDEPVVITAAEHPDLPPFARRRLERRGAQYLRLHVLASVPGTLAEHPIDAPAATPEARVEPVAVTDAPVPEAAPAAAPA